VLLPVVLAEAVRDLSSLAGHTGEFEVFVVGLGPALPDRITIQQSYLTRHAAVPGALGEPQPIARHTAL
jgi:hypothetical protein